ncbi:alpha/beta hydrolase [Parvibaculum sp.]|uniref:alpha/beta fold hydrolase n=1 Tax=Parvibaculum sp. TaxID=2024848 RepID=UPI001D807F4E|nr:alpha/beta hydrolase [Parvibaculum sp.]MBX3488501.1 alpha/beta hydrolase [Parvibaculum sp.]
MTSAKRTLFTLVQNLKIAAEAFGPDQGRPVLLAHGGGQTRHAWQACGKTLGENGYYALAVDLRGHGESDWSPDGDYRMERFAEDILDIADSFRVPPILVGASLGGIAGMIAQGEYAKAGRRGFAALILVDITPQMNIEGVQKIIGFMSENLEEGFASLEEAADTISRYMPGRTRPKDLSGLAKNLRRRENGRYYWHWDPRFITGTQKPQGSREPERLEIAARSLKIPTLLVRGRDSDLVTVEAARQFAEIVPHSEFVDVANAGHMVAGDKNDIFTSAVLDFLTRMAPAASAS